MPQEGVWRLRKLLWKWESRALSCSQLCPWSVKLATKGRFHRHFRERAGASAGWWAKGPLCQVLPTCKLLSLFIQSTDNPECLERFAFILNAASLLPLEWVWCWVQAECMGGIGENGSKRPTFSSKLCFSFKKKIHPNTYALYWELYWEIYM